MLPQPDAVFIYTRSKKNGGTENLQHVQGQVQAHASEAEQHYSCEM